MSDSQKIEPRLGLEVYTNELGTISIKQDDPLADYEMVVVVHPEDVDRLCSMLRRQRDAIAGQESGQ